MADAFAGDRPITTNAEDKLGFAEPARHAADSILRFASPEGFVLGLEGVWGSGKSSLVNLMIAALQGSKNAPAIVKFSPWLISSRDGLLSELFREIGIAASSLEPSEAPLPKIRRPADLLKWWRTRQERAKKRARQDRLKRSLTSFAGNLSRIGKLAEMAEVLGVPYAGLAGRGMQAAGGAANAWSAGPSLETQKEQLRVELRKLPRKIVVFVDDLDRLEPSEAGEVVRLVRAVADFPNVVYVLCYSRQILGQALAKAFGIEKGEEYIDKIVQVAFSVPKPEDFDLRRMFRDELVAIFPTATSVAHDVESRARFQRLASVIDVEGGRTLRTPRDVVRTINALRLYAGPVLDRIDLADMAWLQLIRIRNAKLYEWVEGYINNVAAVANGARVTKEDSEAMASELKELLSKEGPDVDGRFWQFSRVLPGLHKSFNIQESSSGWTLFHDVSAKALAEFVRDKRLGSPEHFRFYFALSKPAGALDDADFEDFIGKAASDPDAAISVFVTLAKEARPQGGVRADPILSRLEGEGIASVSVASIPGILRSLAAGMDAAARVTGRGDWGRYWNWQTADNIFAAALKRLDQTQRLPLIEQIFRDGDALGWLVNILRDEIFAHGRFGAREKPEAERVLTPTEFDTVVEIMLQRFESTPASELMRTPDFVSLLFAWQQAKADGEEAVRAWVARETASDDGLLEFLESCRSWRAVNGKVIYPLTSENLKHFLDFAATRARVKQLTLSANPTIRANAERILAAMDLVDD
jgi:hypothetical protein